MWSRDLLVKTIYTYGVSGFIHEIFLFVDISNNDDLVRRDALKQLMILPKRINHLLSNFTYQVLRAGALFTSLNIKTIGANLTYIKMVTDKLAYIKVGIQTNECHLHEEIIPTTLKAVR